MMRDVGILQVMRTAQGRAHHNAVRKRLLGAIIKSITFLDDHRVMRHFGDAEGVDWRLRGKPFHKHLGPAHWTAEHHYPASLTRGQRVRIRVELAPDPIDADPIDVELRATPEEKKRPSNSPRQPGLPESATFVCQLRVGEEVQNVLTLDLMSEAALPGEVFTWEQCKLRWVLRVAGQEIDLGSTGPHDLYITWGTPDDGGRPFSRPPGTQIPRWLNRRSVALEDGLTHRRVREAVRATEALVKRALTLDAYRDPETGLPPDRADPHTIVRAILGICSYTLRDDDKLRRRYSHSSYFNRHLNAPVGAWPVLEFPSKRAQCQALVRLSRGVAMAIGLPGLVELIVVYPNWQKGKEQEALVDQMLPMDPAIHKYEAPVDSQGKPDGPPGLALGLNRHPGRTDSRGRPEFLVLADQEVEVGERFPYPSVFNTYEACMRFTHGGKTRFYGGGAPDRYHETALGVLHLFKQLVWVRDLMQPDAEPGDDPSYREVTEIVAVYRTANEVPG